MTKVMTLPPEARERLVEGALRRLALLPVCVPGGVPISEEGWLKGWNDLEVGDVANQVTTAAQQLAAVGHSDARALRMTADTFVDEVMTLCKVLRAFACFGPGGLSIVAKHDNLRDNAVAALVGAANGDDKTDDVIMAANAIRQQLQLAGEGSTPDGWLQLFGVPEASLRNADGTFSSALFYATFFQRKEWMADQIAKTVEPFSRHPFSVGQGLFITRAVLDSDVAVLRVWAGHRTCELIEQAMAGDVDRTVAILVDLASRYELSFSNMARVQTNQRRVFAATSELERAEEQLDLYRRVAEGQIRPWAWTIARLLGADGPLPEVGRLRTALDARATHPLAQAFRDVLLPWARNAGAHEDYRYDRGRNELVGSEEVINVDEVEHATYRGHALMVGAEIGWICARAADARLISPADARGEAPPDTQMEIEAVEQFGFNGFRVLKRARAGDSFTVDVEDVPDDLINHAFQALLWASRFLPSCAEFELTVQGRGAIRVRREDLRAIDEVWLAARQSFPYMPTSVFLRPNLACRLEVESAKQADASLAWLLLDDGVRALDEADESQRESPDVLHARLAVAHLGGTVALQRLPAGTPGRLYQAIARMDRLLSAVGRRDTTGIERAGLRVRSLRDSLTVPSPLPTWDPQSLAVR